MKPSVFTKNRGKLRFYNYTTGSKVRFRNKWFTKSKHKVQKLRHNTKILLKLAKNKESTQTYMYKKWKNKRGQVNQIKQCGKRTITESEKHWHVRVKKKKNRRRLNQNLTLYANTADENTTKRPVNLLFRSARELPLLAFWFLALADMLMPCYA